MLFVVNHILKKSVRNNGRNGENVVLNNFCYFL